jgi:hypothetical protein
MEMLVSLLVVVSKFGRGDLNNFHAWKYTCIFLKKGKMSL